MRPMTLLSRRTMSFLRVLAYVAFLAPVSVIVGGDGVSANYSFVVLLLAFHGYRRNAAAAAYVAFMAVSFLVGVALFSDLHADFVLRQFTSFLLALFAVALLFVQLGIAVDEFALACVVAASLYSAYAILSFVMHDFSLLDVYLVKGGLRDYVPDWPQRYVVVVQFAFFIAIDRFRRGLLWQCAAAVCLGCIFLTFTRAAWIAVVCGMFAYVFVPRAATIRSRATPRTALSGVMVGLGAIGVIALLVVALANEGVSGALSTILESTSDVVATRPADFAADGSEGERVELYGEILDTLERNPVTGTGFAGAYLVIAGQGSAHSQFLDVLLRTGVVGLVIYLAFWLKLFRHYLRLDRGIVSGLASMFVFGAFHETTKLSYGAVIFFVLLNKAYFGTAGADECSRDNAVKQPCAAS